MQLEKKAERDKMKKKVTIKEYACKLLQFAYKRKTNPGHTYLDILEKVKAKFPDCNTSHASIAGYATQLRNSGVALPDRPRSKKN